MKKCEECKVWVSTPSHSCPLCGTELFGDGLGEVHVYPKIKKNVCKSNEKTSFLHWGSMVAAAIAAFKIA